MHYTILFPIFGSFRKPNIHLVTNPQGKVTNTACQCHKHSMSVSLLQYVSVTPFTRGEFKVSAFTSPKGPIKVVVLCKIKTYACEGVFIGTFLFSGHNCFNRISLLHYPSEPICDIASLCINLSLKTVQISPPIFGQLQMKKF